MKYNSHSYSAKIVTTALGFFFDTVVCDLYRYTCVVCLLFFFLFGDLLHPQHSSDDQAKSPQFQLTQVLSLAAKEGAISSGLVKGLSPGGRGIKTDALHRSETL